RNRVDLTIRGAGVAVVAGDPELAVRSDLYVVGPQAHRHVVLGIGDLLAVDLEDRHLVARELADEGELPVGSNGHRGDLLARRALRAQGDGIFDLDLLAVDGENADRVVGAIRHQRELPVAAESETRWLLADGHRLELRGWRGGQIDDVDLVVRLGLERIARLDDVERIGDEREALIGRDGDVGGRPRDGVRDGQVDEDPRRSAVLDVDDRDAVSTGRGEHSLSGIIPALLLVVSAD